MNKINNLDDAKILYSIDKKINHIKKDLFNKKDIKNLKFIRLIKDNNLNTQYLSLFFLIVVINITLFSLNPTGFIYFILNITTILSLLLFTIIALIFSVSEDRNDYFLRNL